MVSKKSKKKKIYIYMYIFFIFLNWEKTDLVLGKTDIVLGKKVAFWIGNGAKIP